MKPKNAPQKPQGVIIPLYRKIVSPEKLKILVLSGNDLANEHLTFLTSCLVLIKLDLSYNNLSRLPNSNTLSCLQMLQLQGNRIAQVEAMPFLHHCPKLLYLDYKLNPIHSERIAEHRIVNIVPSLKVINARVVCVQERSAVMMEMRTAVFVDVDFFDQWKATETNQLYYLKVLNLQLTYIDSLWAASNPIIIIQRAWRKIARKMKSSASSPRSRFQRINRQINLIGRSEALREYFQNWLAYSSQRSNVRKALQNKGQQFEDQREYLMLPLPQYKQTLKYMKIRNVLLAYVNHLRQIILHRKMGMKIMSHLSLRATFFHGDTSFYRMSGIHKEGLLYYSRAQHHLIMNFLTLLNAHEKVKFAVSKQFYAIRLVDPETFSNHKQTNSFCTMVWPSMRAVVATKRKVGIVKTKTTIIGIKPLSYIRNRDKVLTKAEFKKSVEIHKRLVKFAENQYDNSLLTAECRDETIMEDLLRMIYYHNTQAVHYEVRNQKSAMMSLLENYEDPCIIYVGFVLRRTAAAVCIQKTWRRLLSNRKQTHSIYQQMRRNRAAMTIQKFLRMRRYEHRGYFNKKLNTDLALFSSSCDLLIPEVLYLELPTILRQKDRLTLYRDIRLTREPESCALGMSEQFYRPLVSKHIRHMHLNDHPLGLQNYANLIDVYNLLHCQTKVAILTYQGDKFYSFTYSSPFEATRIAVIFALLSYQFWRSQYFLPLNKKSLPLWDERKKHYQHLRACKKIDKLSREAAMVGNVVSVREISLNSLFLGNPLSRPVAQAEGTSTVEVQFYQKIYQDYPKKYKSQLICWWLKAEKAVESGEYAMTIELQAKQTKKLVQQMDGLGFLSINAVDKKRFSMYEIGPNPHSRQPRLNSSSFARDNLQKRVKDQLHEKNAKRQMQKESQTMGLRQLREKNKREKIFNDTLRSMQDMEHCEEAQLKVKRVRDFKKRVSREKMELSQQFTQQSNFVMEQQLKMVIMRSKLKSTSAIKNMKNISRQASREPSVDSVKREADHSFKRELVHSTHQPSIALSVPQQTEPALRVRAREKRRPMGAHIRDGTLVHGVFPEEYYPIENRTNTVFFPPV